MWAHDGVVYSDALTVEGRRDHPLELLTYTPYWCQASGQLFATTCFLITQSGARQVPTLASLHEMGDVELSMVAVPFLLGSIVSFASMAEGCVPCNR